MSRIDVPDSTEELLKHDKGSLMYMCHKACNCKSPCFTHKRISSGSSHRAKNQVPRGQHAMVFVCVLQLCHDSKSDGTDRRQMT